MNNLEVTPGSVKVLRVMLSGIFLVAGVNHVAFPVHVAGKLKESAVYEHLMFFMNAEILVIATGIGLLAGGMLLLLNKFTRAAAVLLLALLVPITISVQLQGWSTSGPLFKNIAIAGALLFFIINNFDTIKKEEYESQG